MLQKYEVLLRHRRDASRWSLMFEAENFAHAEEQAQDCLREEPEYEIIRIEKDYG